jgi:isoquinoline 1-oxidoreductase subunit beta
MQRRDFLKSTFTLGSGLVIGFYLPVKGVLAQAPAAAPEIYPPSAFVRIGLDSTITVISKHTEMGQGVYTGLATMIAEELDADWSQMRVESAPVNAVLYKHLMLGIQGTGGSMSVPNAWMQYRTVGATARAMLVQAAAKTWKVPAAEITISKGILSHSSGKTGSFGEFAEAASALTFPTDVTVKTPDQFRLIGTHLPKIDVPAKVNGTATFTIDVRRPGMKVAVIKHSPRFGGKLVSVDDKATRAVPGVVDVVQIPSGVAVVADSTFAAMRGREVLTAQWDFSNAENRGSEEIIRDFTAMTEQPGLPVQKEGDSAAAIAANTGRTLEVTYVFPYLAHACMEPLDTTLELADGVATLRSGTQMQSIEQQRVAEVLGLPLEQVKVETVFAGGGFGRRGNFVPELDAEVAHIVKATGGQYPIRLQYTREDDMRAGSYRPLFVHRMRGALDANGEIVAWENRLVGQSFIENTVFGFLMKDGIDPLAIEGAAELPYHVPNVSVDTHIAKSGVPTLAWRSVGHTHTAFSKETFLDELLAMAGKDPIEARLAMMKDARGIAVIKAAAERYGWDKNKVAEAGKGVGFAYNESFGGRVAQIAEVSVDAAGRTKVDKVVCAVDCGLALNPQIIEAQVESAIMFGLSAAMFGEIKIEQGEVRTSNFHNYPIIRMNQAPQIDVIIMPSTESPTGIGEPATPVIGPAVANAYFKATGKRIRRLPFEVLS